MEVSNILPSISPGLSKEDFKKWKFYQKKDKKSVESTNKDRHSYVQVSLSNIKDILKIKKKFPNLLSKKIKKIHKSINKLRKKKPCINMITKSPSKRQIIVPMGDNIPKLMLLSGDHISNINKSFRNIKFDIIANIVCSDL